MQYTLDKENMNLYCRRQTPVAFFMAYARHPIYPSPYGDDAAMAIFVLSFKYYNINFGVQAPAPDPSYLFICFYLFVRFSCTDTCALTYI